eukprot:TRINITY_DN7349_c0_g1_i1.p1 TRINITY_DN7349_c0_g1~~TRINITY_DN7349_c0_g1_i1.p1  ORF type:complete len:1259 (-),score=225.82 TRINITY_DN7349_c0_g1_i1:38-3778(-)
MLAVRGATWMLGEVTSLFGGGDRPPPGVSRDLLDLVRGIGEARSKIEEDRVITKQLRTLKSLLTQPEVVQQKEFLVRLLYCEMLGHDASFGYINAVKATQESRVLDKRVGYLATCTFLHRNHEFVLLLISSIRRDLLNPSEVCIAAALCTTTFLINSETLPAVLPLVIDHLQHPRSGTRKRAIMAMQQFNRLSSEEIPHMAEYVRRALCDTDPSVMGAALPLLFDLVKADSRAWIDTTSSLANILKQIVGQKLSHHYDYHNVPAPWLQISLLRILAHLGRDNHKASEQMYDILREVLQKATSGKSNGAFAVSYECVKTITSIIPRSDLLQLAAQAVASMLASSANNLKYMGIEGLSAIVQLDPSQAHKHQLHVVQCLQDPDESLQYKTLDLLYKMTNPLNVEVVVERLIDHLNRCPDSHLRQELVSRITLLAERYAPNNGWFIDTMISVFELGGNLVRPHVAHNLMHLIAEGTEDEVADRELCSYAVSAFYGVLLREVEENGAKRLPDALIHLGVWVLSEYAFLSKSVSLISLLSLFIRLLTCSPQIDASTRAWILTAITKNLAQLGGDAGPLESQLRNVLHQFKYSNSSDLQQRCYELESILHNPSLMQQVLPLDASMQDMEVDSHLSFLDTYVRNEISANGARPYVPPRSRAQPAVLDSNLKLQRNLKWEKYELPAAAMEEPSVYTPASPPLSNSSSTSFGAPAAVASYSSPAATNKSAKWTSAGYSEALSTQQPTSTFQQESSSSSSFSHDSSKGSYEYAREDRAASLNEQQLRMAEGIFRGLSPSTGGGGYGGRTTTLSQPSVAKTRRGAWEEQPTSTHNRPQHQATGGDIFAGLSTADSTPDRPSHIQQQQQQLQEVRSLPTPTYSPTPTPAPTLPVTAPASAPVPSYATPASLLDFDFALPAASSPKQSSQPSGFFNTPSSTPKIDDLLFDPIGSNAIEAETLQTRMLLAPKNAELYNFTTTDLTTLPFKGAIADQLQSEIYPRHPSPSAAIGQDMNLEICYYLAYKETETVAVVFVCNKTQGSFSNVSATVSVPSTLSVHTIQQEGIAINEAAEKYETEVVLASPGMTSRTVMPMVLVLGFKEHSFNVALKVSVSYTDGSRQNRRLSGSIPLLFTDFIRTFPQNTSTFGERWTKALHESKTPIISLSTMEDVIAFLQKRVHLSHVQTIGKEAIFSGHIMNRDDSSFVCLVHARQVATTTTITTQPHTSGGGEGVELTVRSGNKFYSDSLVRSIGRLTGA